MSTCQPGNSNHSHWITVRYLIRDIFWLFFLPSVACAGRMTLHYFSNTNPPGRFQSKHRSISTLEFGPEEQLCHSRGVGCVVFMVGMWPRRSIFCTQRNAKYSSTKRVVRLKKNGKNRRHTPTPTTPSLRIVYTPKNIWNCLWYIWDHFPFSNQLELFNRKSNSNFFCVPVWRLRRRAQTSPSGRYGRERVAGARVLTEKLQ